MHYVGPALVFVAGRELGYDRIAFAPVLAGAARWGYPRRNRSSLDTALVLYVL